MEINKKTLRSIFFGAAGCIVLYWLLHEPERVKGAWKVISGVFSPFVVGAALAFILNVPMRGIEGMLGGIPKPGLRRLLALLLTILAFILVLAAVFLLLIPQIIQTIQTLIPHLQAFFVHAEAWVQNFLNDNPQLLEWIRNNTDLESLDWPGLIQKGMTMLGNSLTTVTSRAFSAIGGVVNAVVDAVISLVFSLYCLFRKEILARQGRRLAYSFLPERFCDEVVRILRLTNATFSNFISGQCLEACILGCLFAVSMLLFRMPYIPLVSVLVAVTALVPVVGAFIGCIFGAFFILVDDPVLAVWFVVMFLVLQQLENNLIYPRVVGTSIGLPGMWVLLAVAVGGELMGVGGMLLMIPLTSVVYTLLREITDRRLASRKISREKLTDHPPELQSRFKKHRERKKESIAKQKEQKGK